MSAAQFGEAGFQTSLQIVETFLHHKSVRALVIRGVHVGGVLLRVDFEMIHHAVDPSTLVRVGLALKVSHAFRVALAMQESHAEQSLERPGNLVFVVVPITAPVRSHVLNHFL